MPFSAKRTAETAAEERRAEIILVYRTGGVLAVDQHNIALLTRVVARATSQITAEVYYHLPARLSDWTRPAEGVRYTRLANASEWPIAERIMRKAHTTFIIFDATLLIADSDVWQLIGYGQQHSQVLLMPKRTAPAPHESRWGFSLREARLHLQHTIWSHVADASAMSVLSAAEPFGGVRKQITFAQILKGSTNTDIFMFYGNSRAISARQAPLWLATGVRSIAAFRHWQHLGAFPKDYSRNTPLFHVAQIAVYAATLLSLSSLLAGAIVLAFAIAITPRYFFGGLRLMKPMVTLRRLTSRFFLYYVG